MYIRTYVYSLKLYLCNVFPNEVQPSLSWWWPYGITMYSSCSKTSAFIPYVRASATLLDPCTYVCTYVYILSSLTFNCLPFVSQMVHIIGQQCLSMQLFCAM